MAGSLRGQQKWGEGCWQLVGRREDHRPQGRTEKMSHVFSKREAKPAQEAERGLSCLLTGGSLVLQKEELQMSPAHPSLEIKVFKFKR